MSASISGRATSGALAPAESRGRCPLARAQRCARGPVRTSRLVVRAEKIEEKAAKATPSSQIHRTRPREERAKGRDVYYPETFDEIVRDAVVSIKTYIDDGGSLMEVEFPPLPGNVDGYKGASDVFIDSNVTLALAAARYLGEQGLKCHLVVPDEGELARSERMCEGKLDKPGEGVTMGCLTGREGVEGGLTTGWAATLFKAGTQAPIEDAGAAAADVFLVINASTQELPAVERFADEVAKGRPVVLWNLELDTLRGDLGLLAFPPKAMQYRFLCKVKPVFYLRTRQYSKSVNVAPFLINYSGALFREYPGPWQVMIRTDDGRLCCVAEEPIRYTLGEFKEELMAAMGLDTEEEGSAAYFLRRGGKTSTWWEDAFDEEESPAWRS
ncbi:unnamed protein product [Pedinophyceae sp. YPF-701]|nr:unnamed protein product [Pedinophyceae sp. YPF-701]